MILIVISTDLGILAREEAVDKPSLFEIFPLFPGCWLI